MKRLAILLTLAATATAIAVVTTATARGPFTQRAVVVRALGGDALLVRLPSGARERVRVRGIASPSGSECYSSQGLTRMRALTGRKRITLVGDGASRDRDGARRLLAYVRLPDGSDLGRVLVAEGAATADLWGAPFGRFPTYLATQQLAEKNVRGLWRACATDVAVTIAADEQAYELGATATYTLTVANRGAVRAPAVSVDLRPSAGGELASLPDACTDAVWHATCTFGDLASDDSASVKLAVRLTRAGVASVRAASTFTWCIRTPCASVPLTDTNRENDTSGALALVVKDIVAGPPPALCDPSYPSVCIPSPPPDLDCNDLPVREFRVRRDVSIPDPHRLDQSEDGIACQFDDY